MSHQRPTLTNLPEDVQILILSLLPNRSTLLATLQSLRPFHPTFASRRRHILSSILYSEVASGSKEGFKYAKALARARSSNVPRGNRAAFNGVSEWVNDLATPSPYWKEEFEEGECAAFGQVARVGQAAEIQFSLRCVPYIPISS